MQASAVAKVEAGDRRVDVDDLEAFAVALNVPLARLLVPDVEEDEEVRMVPGLAVPSVERLAVGERAAQPLDGAGRPQRPRRAAARAGLRSGAPGVAAGSGAQHPLRAGERGQPRRGSVLSPPSPGPGKWRGQGAAEDRLRRHG